MASYRADHGTYPAKLADLAPVYVVEVPKDIFDDSDLHYRLEGNGYLLYSVGVNGRDDGAKGCEDCEQGEGWDDCSSACLRPNKSEFAATGIHSTHFHVDVLARHLTGKHDAYLANSYWGEPNGDEEYDEGPFSRRLSYLNQSSHIIRGHWVGGWHFATHPLIQSVVLNRVLKTAVVYFREGYGGGVALMQRDDQGWRVMGRESTWIE